MNRLNVIYHMAKADFLERTRSYAFLIVLALTIIAAYTFIPSPDAGYTTVRVNGNTVDGGVIYRGIYDSAWVGVNVTMLSLFFLSLFGFYLVKNTIGRDRRTGIGQIIAATPITRPMYTIGKAASNFAVLSLLALIMMVCALAMQLIRGESYSVDVIRLAMPFAVILLPAVAVISSLAVLFESISLLRGGFGNIAYFFLWIVAFLIVPIDMMPAHSGNDPAVFADALGLNIPFMNIEGVIKSTDPGFTFGGFSMGFTIAGNNPIHTFAYPGVDWTPTIIASRVFWLAIAFAIAAAASIFFDRFNVAADKVSTGKKAGPSNVESITSDDKEIKQIRLTPLVGGHAAYNLPELITGELRLMLKGQPWWWLSIAGLLIVLGVMLPPDDVKRFVLPVSWIWPILIWSSMGTREATYNTGSIVFSSPHPVRSQIPAVLIAGVIVAMVAGSGALLSMIMSGDMIGILAWAIGAMFIPAMALAMGVWTGSSKLFEIAYLILWYIGPINGLKQLDYIGATGGSFVTPVTFMVITIVLVAAIVIGRIRQIKTD